MSRKVISRPSAMGIVYLLHFQELVFGHRHYLGWSGQLSVRLEQHATGEGSVVTKRAYAKNVNFTLARTWEGTQRLERLLATAAEKNPVGYAAMCPICSGCPMPTGPMP